MRVSDKSENASDKSETLYIVGRSLGSWLNQTLHSVFNTNYCYLLK